MNADGNSLPYEGYIEVEIQIKNGLPKAENRNCLLLVVPDTKYSKKTPVILGTNVLQEILSDCQDKNGDQFLQKTKMYTPWYLSLRTIVLREREWKRNPRIAIVRSAIPHKILLKPNQCINIKGYLDK